MTGGPLFAAALRDRRRAWIWWAVALLVTAIMIAGSYGAVAGQASLDETFEDIPDSLRVLMGIDEDLALTSPAGYLNSQWFANFLPMLLSIYGIGVASRLLAGEEDAGRLELLLAHPVTRRRVFSERCRAAVLLLALLFLVPAVTLVALAPAFDLGDVGFSDLSAAHGATLALALLHTAVTYGVGAWSGRRGVAMAAGATVMGGGFLLQSLANVSSTLRPLRWLSPWHWFIDARPIVDGWAPLVVPSIAAAALAAAAVVAGAWRFERRDIGAA